MSYKNAIRTQIDAYENFRVATAWQPAGAEQSTKNA